MFCVISCLNKASRCLAELLQSADGQAGSAISMRIAKQELEVHFLCKFLTQRGRSAAAEMRPGVLPPSPIRFTFGTGIDLQKASRSKRVAFTFRGR